MFLLLIISINLNAELPPWAYEDYQNSASEKVVIKVDKVKTTLLSNTMKSIKLRATVLIVNSSSSGLHKNDKITIVYSITFKRKNGWVGPSPIPILKVTELYTAYLHEVSKGYYKPAAMGKSFTSYKL